jgi:hypothetical protein
MTNAAELCNRTQKEAHVISETDEAVIIANKILDRVNADPDDDLAILARQFLRAREQIAKMEGRREPRPVWPVK